MIKWAKKLYLRATFRLDTTPDKFDQWFRKKLGEKLQGGNVYYAVGEKGRSGVPRIGKKWQVYQNYQDAEKKRKDLQPYMDRHILAVKVIRVFYSELEEV